ncbi:hypothetical protein K504DRAFT_482355 [Pleomassaria siparia CBS 279.74]|uniref:Uncharacterized protein n=1 Tax=Pleomassaria siparia CBS 279.74 TaxID=1314801 RepID=A0A6G1K7L2_9PLEO|nr:hypothetical protein K504DRAFT_482355 [Pleomassaria siparia CBS 279.74]
MSSLSSSSYGENDFDSIAVHLNFEQAEEEEDDDEPTILEYARFHGLCVDYTSEQPRVDDIAIPSSETLQTDLQDPPECPTTNPAIELTKERLTLNKEAALLLQAVHLLRPAPVDNETDKIKLPLEDWRQSAKLKQEVPLLRTDHELDMKSFGNTDTPSFTRLEIPLEVINVEKDEGLQWPAKYRDYPAQCDEKARAERLQVSKEDLRFLQGALTDSWTIADSERIKEEGLSYGRKPSWQSITPPLLPLTPPVTPYIPSSPDNHFELLSESTDSVAVEAKALQDSIMKHDALIRPGSDGSDSMLFGHDGETGMFSEYFDKQPSPSPKRKIQDLKIEGPLTPPIFSESPMKKLKRVSFPEMLHEYIAELPSTFESGNDVLDASDSFSELLNAQVQPYHDEVMRKVENERLSEADTTARVEVPYVDFALPMAPWNELTRKNSSKHSVTETELDAQTKFLVQVKRNELKSVSSCHGLGKLERGLSWQPVPNQKITIDEKLDGEGVSSKMLAEITMSEIATSSTEVWKQDGLRILDRDEDNEDELEVAEAEAEEEKNDMEALVRKRKLEMEEEAVDARTRKKEMRVAESAFDAPISQLSQPHLEAVQSHHWGAQPTATSQPRSPSPQSGHKERDRSLMFGGASFLTAMQKFKEDHGKPVKSTDVGEGETTNPNRPALSPFTALPRRRSKVLEDPPKQRPHAVAHEASKPIPEAQPPPLPKLPAIPEHLPLCSFVISSTLFQQRSLSRNIEKLYPDAGFIERDFNSPLSIGQEADLTLSPSTGLIFTLLQIVKQRPLPGQRDHSPLIERVSKLQYRYERLVVLISEGVSKDMEEKGSGRPVDDRDKEAITAFENFASKMEGEVIVKYVRGGELALARSIVGEMATWGLPHGSKDIGGIKLLQDETCWEHFLRRAGLNSFASQAILASPQIVHHTAFDSDFPGTSESYPSAKTLEATGLAAFILMSPETRVKNFQALLGGSRILMRVNRLLEQKWLSAVNGFVM